MPISLKDHPHRILLLLTGLAVILLGIAIFLIPPGIDPDPCWGFMIMHSMEHGGHFNLLVSPSYENIAQNRYEFLSWWSPGQYLLPYFLKSLLKINTGQAVSLTIAICSLLGLAGFYQLFKQLGFTKWVSAISTAFIASQLFFILPFTYFTGGEVLLFAFLGWFLYGCSRIKKITWPVLVFIFLGGLLGFFSKSSFLWMYAAALACIWINSSVNEIQSPDIKKRLWSWLKNGIMLAIPFICAVAIIYIFYLSKGDNPTSDQGTLLIRPETFTFPLASPILSGFSIDELFDGLIYHPDAPTFSYNFAVFILILSALGSLAYMFFIARLSPDRKYTHMVFAFYIVGTIFFSYMYLKQATISYEGRHFRIIGLLCIPGFVYLCFKTKITRVLFFVLWIWFIYASYNHFGGEYSGNKAAARGNTGLSHQGYDKVTMAEIVKIDHDNRNAIFVLTGSDIAAEIYNNRIITVDDDMPDKVFETLKYSGKAGPLYILVPAKYLTNGRKSDLIRAFPGYHNFTCKQLSPNYYLYYAKD